MAVCGLRYLHRRSGGARRGDVEMSSRVDEKCRDRVRFIKELSKEVWATHESRPRALDQIVKEERMITWTLPIKGWFKLNTNGALHVNPLLATFRGVVSLGLHSYIHR